MGNVLRCLEEEDDHGGRDQYPYYRPSSRPQYQPPYYSHDQPAAAPARPHQQALGAHGVTAPSAGDAALDQYILNFKTTSMAAVPDITYLQAGRRELVDDRVLSPHHQHSTEDIDESSAEGLSNAENYAKANEMLIQVHVLGTTKTFWRLSDEATRISRKLALILRSHHLVGKYLSAPLQVSNVRISSSGSVKLRGVSFASKRFSIQRVRDDYKYLSRVLQVLIRISGGDITKLPPDYEEFLALLESNTLTAKHEFLIVNNPALLPMSNRTEVFLMLYDRIVTSLGRTKAGRAKKKRILSNLPYEDDWLDTATANTEINQYVINVKKQYKKTQLDQLRLNRNVRSHLHQYSDDNMEEILYYEWPELLMDMVKMLHMEGELQSTDIQNKFG